MFVPSTQPMTYSKTDGGKELRKKEVTRTLFVNFGAEKRKMPGGPHILGGVEEGWIHASGGWTLPRYTTSVSPVSLSAESQVRQQTEATFSTKIGQSVILLCCLTRHNVFSFM